MVYSISHKNELHIKPFASNLCLQQVMHPAISIARLTIPQQIDPTKRRSTTLYSWYWVPSPWRMPVLIVLCKKRYNIHTSINQPRCLVPIISEVSSWIGVLSCSIKTDNKKLTKAIKRSWLCPDPIMGIFLTKSLTGPVFLEMMPLAHLYSLALSLQLSNLLFLS